MGTATTKYTARKLTAREKQLKALELRKRGYSYDQIALSVGYTHRSAAYKAISSLLGRLDREHGPEVLELELARLDDMQRSLATKVLIGDDKAIRTSLRIMDRRAKLLGLDHNEARQADAVEAMAIAYTTQVGWLQTAIVAIIARMNLSPEQQAAAPVIIAGYLEEAAPDVV